jgi:hypothetical protein
MLVTGFLTLFSDKKDFFTSLTEFFGSWAKSLFGSDNGMTGLLLLLLNMLFLTLLHGKKRDPSGVWLNRLWARAEMSSTEMKEAGCLGCGGGRGVCACAWI